MAEKPTVVPLGEAGYTLTLELHRVIPAQVVYKDSYDKTGTKVPREVIEQGRLVLRDSDPEGLKLRAASAISILIPSTTNPNKEQ